MKSSESPTPVKTERKLKLSKETLVQMTQENTVAACTKRRTGCPIHTC